MINPFRFLRLCWLRLRLIGHPPEVRELIMMYPDNKWFHHVVLGLSGDVLDQLYSDIIVRGAPLVQTVEEWNAIPKLMGWHDVAKT